MKGKGGGAETNSLDWWKVGERQGGGAETNSLVWWKVGERQGGWGRNK